KANLHFHTLVLDGVFTEAPGGALAFHPARGPRDAEVTAALTTIRHRVHRLLVRHGLEPADDARGPADRLADESPVLAGVVGAAGPGGGGGGARARGGGGRGRGGRGPPAPGGPGAAPGGPPRRPAPPHTRGGGGE